MTPLVLRRRFEAEAALLAADLRGRDWTVALTVAGLAFGLTVGNAALLVACVVSRREHR